jgi:hypothetical protein
MGCFTWIVLLAGAIFLMVSMLRWFEQVTEAVELRWWNKVFMLVVMPFSVWLFESRVSAGRPSAVPAHEPVRGFGGLPKGGINPTSSNADTPPPGTPKEFLVKPQVPPPSAKPKSPRAGVDPDKLAKLRQKMREQGMLGPDDDAGE